MQTFQLIIKNEKIKTYRLIRLLIIIAGLGGMIYLLVNSAKIPESIVPGLALIAGVFLLFKIKNSFFIMQWPRVVLLLCAIAWIASEHWFIATGTILFLFFDFLTHRPLMVTVKKEFISYPSFVNEKIAWTDLNNLILKDDLLTIDFKSNKLFQHLIAEDKKEFTEKQFNEFCNNCLKENLASTHLNTAGIS